MSRRAQGLVTPLPLICFLLGYSIQLPEPGCAATHDFALADELGIKFATIKGKENVKVHTCDGLSEAVWG